MKIKFKIFIITFLLFIISFSRVSAIDMFLTNSISTTNNNVAQIIEGNNSNIQSEEIIAITSPSVTNPSSTVSQTSTSAATLSVSDIIDIILIAVCIVLIFLAIAILIRCK